MSITRIAYRYAKSLLDLAQEQTLLEEVVKDITHMSHALDIDDFKMLIKSPIINSQRKKEIFDKLFKHKLNPLTLSFLSQTIQKRREALLPDIIKEFQRQYNELNKISDVTVTFAKNPTDDLIAKVKSKLEQSGVVTDNVHIHVLIDPAIIGGYIIQFEDRRFDASVSFKLEKLKQQFSNT